MILDSKKRSYIKHREKWIAYQKKWRKKHPGYSSKFYSDPIRREQKRKADRLYQKNRRKNVKGYKARESQKYRDKNPEKVAAHYKLFIAIGKGVVKRSPCEICGENKRIHAHHDDYSKPLEVRWLCPIHHKQVHKK